MVDDRPITHILEEMQVMELARSAGLCLKHNCNRFWRVDGAKWDQAVLICTRYLPMTEASAEAVRLAAEQASSLALCLGVDTKISPVPASTSSVDRAHYAL